MSNREKELEDAMDYFVENNDKIGAEIKEKLNGLPFFLIGTNYSSAAVISNISKKALARILEDTLSNLRE